MPTRDTAWPTGIPCWIDVMTPDVQAAQQFYSQLFGWQFADHGPQYGGYHLAASQGRPVAGLGPVMREGEPTVWSTYFATDDIALTSDRIRQAGGTMMVEPMEVPQMGHMAIAVDPQGAVFGLWQASGMIGMQRFNEDNAPVWNDLHTTDVEKASQFYAHVFGFTVGDSHMPGRQDYRTFTVEGEGRGGITALEDAPAEVPPHWLSWIMVADADATAQAATERGATLVAPPFDAPWGRSAIFTDPWGATLAVMQPSAG